MNYGEWVNADYNAAIEASKTLTGSERFEQLYIADKILMEEMPVLPVYYYTNPVMVQEYVTDWELTTRSTWFFGFADVVK